MFKWLWKKDEVEPDIDVMQSTKAAVERGKIKREETICAAEVRMEQIRREVANKYEKRVDKLISQIPTIVEKAVAADRILPWRTIKIEEVSLKEMKNHDLGWCDPNPGTYVEYLLNRLKSLGFTPHCEYDYRKMRWYGFVSINHPNLD